MIVSSAQFSRRRIIPAAALTPLAAAAASAANFDPEDPRALLAAFQKLAGFSTGKRFAGG